MSCPCALLTPKLFAAKFARRTLPHDKYSAHDGKNPDGLLGQMDPPVTRVRILGKCTAELAAVSVYNNRLSTCVAFTNE